MLRNSKAHLAVDLILGSLCVAVGLAAASAMLSGFTKSDRKLNQLGAAEAAMSLLFKGLIRDIEAHRIKLPDAITPSDPSAGCSSSECRAVASTHGWCATEAECECRGVEILQTVLAGSAERVRKVQYTTQCDPLSGTSPSFVMTQTHLCTNGRSPVVHRIVWEDAGNLAPDTDSLLDPSFSSLLLCIKPIQASTAEPHAKLIISFYGNYTNQGITVPVQGTQILPIGAHSSTIEVLPK